LVSPTLYIHKGTSLPTNATMLKAIFYARFHPERGPDILHQHPAGSISRSVTAAGGLSSSISSAHGGLSLLPFSSISAYVIPPHELSNRSLAICAQGFRVLGFPSSIEGEGYERNRFVFNVCFVLEEREEVGCWEGVVGKMAGFMKGLEIEGEGGVLRREEREVDERVARGEDEEEMDGVVGRVLREVFEQVNRYAECCVWVSKTQVLNLRLEKSGRGSLTSRKVRAWDVPLLIRELPDQQGWTWDLVLEKVHPFVDGVNHVKRIARLADVDMKLVKKAARELVLHERVMLLDIFHFQAVYTLTADIALFVKNVEVIDECREYVAIDPKEGMFASVLDKQVIDESSGTPDRTTILELYSILKPGLSVADFCLAHQNQLANIDVRRFITFGIIKGFLKRMHKYALALDPPNMQVAAQSTVADIDKAWRKAALSSGWATPPVDAVSLQEKLESEEEKARQEGAKLVKFLDGKHCLDQICVEMGMHEKEVLGKVKSGKFGEVTVFCR
jgi:hypothetical protein